MPPVGWLPAPAEEVFGPGATAEEAYDLLTVDVPAEAWLTALERARDTLGCTYFDWLSAVDEPGTGFRVAAHVVALGPSGGSGPAVRRLLVRTTVPHDAPALPTATGVYAGASWHERETYEMFGVHFTGHPGLAPLLLPEGFEGHPLRKDFVLAARVAKAWPGAKEPGESDHGGPKRRQMLPPGVPDPNEWGPLKGQLPPAPARPARGARAAGAAAGERPVRRARTAGAGSASQRAEAAGAAAPTEAASTADASTADASTEAAAPAAARPARRTRTASGGSASQRSGAPEAGAPAAPTGGGTAPGGPRRARTAAQGSASQRAGEARPEADSPPTGTEGSGAPAAPARRSSDAPWHHPRPAHDEPPAPAERKPSAAETGSDTPAEAEPPAPAERKPSAPGAEPPEAEPDTPATPETNDRTGGDA
ncbi:dehydrogenase [Streptomyces albus subsp. albus]|nr:dehydrogenase [Streptomyces albus subsp. albus]